MLPKKGDVVFFKRVRASMEEPFVEYEGHGFGILLGHLPRGEKEPPVEHMIRLLGTIGIVHFDDVGEFLGAEAMKEVIRKFQDKYYGRALPQPVDPNQAELPLVPRAIDGVSIDDGKVTRIREIPAPPEDVL